MGRASRIAKWIKSSWEYTSKGASARKLTAFAIMVCVVFVHFIWMIHSSSKGDFSLLISVLYADYSFVGLLLGMTTYQYIKDNSSKPGSNE